MEQIQTKKKSNPLKVEANFLLVIAITGIVAFILNTVTMVLFATKNIQAGQVSAYIAFPADIAQIVFIILNFTKWKAVRDHTKIDYHCVTVAYIIPLAIAIALAIASLTPLPNNAIIAITVIEAAIDLYVLIYSFIMQAKVRAYVK